MSEAPAPRPATVPAAAGRVPRRHADLDTQIARLLTAGTYVSIGLLAIGVLGMLAAGQSPFAGGPSFAPGRLIPDLVALRPEGFLWLGLIAVISTPSLRVAASLIGYLRSGERAMAVISALILGIIFLSVALAIGTEG